MDLRRAPRVGGSVCLRSSRRLRFSRTEEDEGADTRAARPVHMVDERLTTVEGERALRAMGASPRARKRAIDQVAAQLILQQFLERRRREEP